MVLPGIDQAAAMLNQGMATITQFAFAPLNMLMSLGQGAAHAAGQAAQGPYGAVTGAPDIRQRRDERTGITPGERDTQQTRIRQQTDKAGIYVYVRPGAPEGSKGTIIF